MSKKVPETLGELMDRDLAGWQLAMAYYLELEHGLMGFFPAIIAETGQMVLCLDENLLVGGVKELLPERRCRQREILVLANEQEAICFQIANEHGVETKAGHILTDEEFEELTEGESEPFKWTPGLI